MYHTIAVPSHTPSCYLKVFLHYPSYALSDISGSGNEDGQYLYNRATQNNNETAHIYYLVRFKQQAKRSDDRESCQKRVACF